MEVFSLHFWDHDFKDGETKQEASGRTLEVNFELGLRSEPPFTGVTGPSGPEIAKSVSKRVFFGVWRKVSKNTRKSPKIPIFGPFWVFFGILRLFRVFFETFLQTLKKTLFETFLRFLARRARRLL